MTSPYLNIPTENWKEITKQLLSKHPLSEQELVDITLSCWDSIFASRFGKSSFRIGKDIFPKPQIMGFLLHELIPLELESRLPGKWKIDQEKKDKDCVCIINDYYSFEIKTSSNPSKIFGNRSYAQGTNNSRKAKDGFYLTVNFEKFEKQENQEKLLKDIIKPSIRIIRFGWLDYSDWRGQTAATGQQSNLSKEVYEGKLKVIYKS